MIVIHVDSMEDTARLKKAYMGLEHVKLLYNPSKEEVIGQLERGDDILNEVDLFCEKINAFLKEGVPMEQWVDMLQAGCHKEKDFVRFNYEGMKWRG